MKYIQIKNNGEFVIYPTEKYRLKHKNATPKEVILAEYDKHLKEQDDKISSYLADKGIDPYKLTKEEIEYWLQDPFITSCAKEYDKWGLERHQYYEDCRRKKGNKGHKYPNMSAIHPDIENSVPYIIEGGNTWWDDETNLAEEKYKEAKRKGRFGETKDC